MQKPVGQYSCLLANNGDHHGLERPASAARAPCLPVGRPQTPSWTQVAEPSCRRSRGSADNSGRNEDKPCLRTARQLAGIHRRHPRGDGIHGRRNQTTPHGRHGADLRPPARQPRREPGPTAGGVISRAGSAAVGATPAKRWPGRSTRPPPISSQASRAARQSGVRAPPDFRRGRAA